MKNCRTIILKMMYSGMTIGLQTGPVYGGTMPAMTYLILTWKAWNMILTHHQEMMAGLSSIYMEAVSHAQHTWWIITQQNSFKKSHRIKRKQEII
eukprot:9970112-Ditylum_brightwellii.AAC.1